MQVKEIIQEIELLPLDKKFFVMEQTLKSIKKEELKQQSDSTDLLKDDSHQPTYIVSEKSLSKEWLSKEDELWDNLL